MSIFAKMGGFKSKQDGGFRNVDILIGNTSDSIKAINEEKDKAIDEIRDTAEEIMKDMRKVTYSDNEAGGRSLIIE